METQNHHLHDALWLLVDLFLHKVIIATLFDTLNLHFQGEQCTVDRFAAHVTFCQGIEDAAHALLQVKHIVVLQHNHPECPEKCVEASQNTPAPHRLVCSTTALASLAR